MSSFFLFLLLLLLTSAAAAVHFGLLIFDEVVSLFYLGELILDWVPRIMAFPHTPFIMEFQGIFTPTEFLE